MDNFRLLLHQARLEQRAFWRNPQTAFFTFVLPIGLLLIFGALAGNGRVPHRPGIRLITLSVPGMLAFAVIVTAYGNLSATIAVLRAEGILKRIRAVPLPPAIYLTGHLVNTLLTVLLIAITSMILGWSVFGVAPLERQAVVLAMVLCLGIVCFAGLGLALSTVIRSADAAGPISNGTYLPLALLSGVFSAAATPPHWLAQIVAVFPVKALVDGLQAAYDPAIHGVPIGDLVVLAAWAGLGILLARRYFRWQPA